MNICIPKFAVDAFKEKLIKGEVSPEKLTDMSSAERRDSFGELFGKDIAKEVNAQFESKLLLKNQQQGIINWAKKITGMKPDVLNDIVQKANNMTEALNPKDLNNFLNDIVEKRLGVGVTMEEAGKISSLAKVVAEKKTGMSSDFTFPTDEARMDYGRARVAFSDYVADLKNESSRFKVSDLKTNPVGSIFKGVKAVGGLAKSLKASLDLSMIGRQGLKMAFTNPDIWFKNSLKTISDAVDTFGGKEVMKEVRADVLSRPNELNGLYRKEKVALGTTEEAYPSSLPEKIPFLGKAFKASEDAFTAFQYRNRADVFDRYVEIADKTGGDIKGLGLVANSLTGRGYLGKAEGIANFTNNLLFSPRFVKSNLDILTGQLTDYRAMGALSRRVAAMNTLKVVVGIAGILSIAKAVNPDSVDTGRGFETSSDLGKIRLGNTTYDVSGGAGSLATLAMRLIEQKSKSSTSKKITALDSGKFGGPTTGSTLLDFFSNKLSPAAGSIRDMRQGHDFNGNKTTLLNVLNNLLTPLPVTNFLQMKGSKSTPDMIVTMMADALGVGTNITVTKKK